MEESDIDCPYCGENITVFLDHSIEQQSYYEDCSVCCHPILFLLSIDDFNTQTLIIKRDDE